VLFLIGIVLGVIMAVSSDRFISLLKTDDKVLFDFIKGKASFSAQFSRVLIKFIIPIILLFLFNLTHYTCFLSFGYFIYSGALFFLGGYAVITEFGFSGALSFILLGLPVNLLIILLLTGVQELFFTRCMGAKRYKKWTFGFDADFWFKFLIAVGFGLICSVLIVVFLLLVLESRIFMIF
jgi:hypothetical protein